MCTVRKNESDLKCENDQCYYNSNGEVCNIGYAETNTELPIDYSYAMDSIGYPTVPYSRQGHYVAPTQPIYNQYQTLHIAPVRNYCYPNAVPPGIPPCAGPQPWDYGYCYGATGSPCQFIDVVDMEDFMNNEKRKEKSRDAARCRRSRETEIFTELSQQLPLKKEEVEHLDKASIMRLSISFLKVRNMLDLFPHIQEVTKRREDYEETKLGTLVKRVDSEYFALNSLNGFLIVLSGDGEITFVSENISEFLGLSQIDLMGQPIWDYCHQCDHEELRDALHGRHLSKSELLNGGSKDGIPVVQRSLFLRFKCTLTSRGRSVNIKSASYKVINITGHIAYNGEYRQLAAIGSPLPHPANIEVPLGSTTFLTKHSLDMNFIYVDDKMYNLLGYTPEHLLTKSMFTYHHAEDSDKLLKNFKCLINKGQMQTSSYRFLARCGGYAWIVTQATIVYDKQKPQSVVCVNYVISGIENKDEIYSCAQLEACEKEQKTIKSSNNSAERNVEQQLISIKNNNNTTTNCTKNLKSVESNILQQQQSQQTVEPLKKVQIEQKSEIIAEQPQPEKENRPRSVTASIFAASKLAAAPQPKRGVPVTSKIFSRPEPATAKIFAPRTEDMNKGFLTFADDESGLTMLKDEPEDLTHLAPTAGDECIPLEETTPFFSDMFDEFIMPDSYSSLLPDDISSLDSAQEDEEQKCVMPTLCNTSRLSSPSSPNSSSTMVVTSSTTSSNGSSPSASSNTTSNSCNSSLTDPYINYRDELSEASNSPHLLSSPSGIEKSPDANSMPSLSSPHGSLPEDDLAFMTLNMEDEMEMRAPYISMSETDDLPLLISDDLMWGAHPETVSLAKELKQSIAMAKQHQQQQQQQQQHDSSLAALLCKEKKSENTVQQLGGTETNDQIVNPLDVMGFKNGSEWSMNDLLQLNAGSTVRISPTCVSASATTVVPPPPPRKSPPQQQQQQQQIHKRPHTIIDDGNAAKRAKSSSTTITLMNFQPVTVSTTQCSTATPHLLHQLIAAPQQPMQQQMKVMKQEDAPSTPSQPPPPPVSTNSVLMNLLVSGCDVSAGYTCFPRPTKAAKA